MFSSEMNGEKQNKSCWISSVSLPYCPIKDTNTTRENDKKKTEEKQL